MMNSGRTSRVSRPVTRDRGGTEQWAEKSVKMAEVTYSPYSPPPQRGNRRPFTAPNGVANANLIDAADIGSLVSRLARPNTSSARKAVLWSKPRKEYEYNYEVASSLKNPVLYWAQFPMLQKHYPGTWRAARSGELGTIINRLSKSTVASESRKEDCVTRRKVIEKVKEEAILADIGICDSLKSERPKPRFLPPLTSVQEQEKSQASGSITSAKAGQRMLDFDEPAESIPESAHQIDK